MVLNSRILRVRSSGSAGYSTLFLPILWIWKFNEQIQALDCAILRCCCFDLLGGVMSALTQEQVQAVFQKIISDIKGAKTK